MTEEFFEKQLTEYNIEFSKFIGYPAILKAEKMLGIKFGDELKLYLMKYSNLQYNNLQFNGISLKDTTHLYKNFKLHRKYIVFEINSDKNYILVDSSDKIYLYNPYNQKLFKCGEYDLFSYIIKRILTESLTFPIVVNTHKEDKHNYFRIPDLNVVFKGKNLGDCIDKANDIISQTYYARKSEGKKLPKPSLADNIETNDGEVVITLVPKIKAKISTGEQVQNSSEK